MHFFKNSTSVPKGYRYVDGTHYLQEDYTMLAEVVAECVRKELKDKVDKMFENIG